jgi:hypothetical protein
MMDSIYAYRYPIHAAPPEPGGSLGAPLTSRLVFVLIDALRLDTASDPQVMPFLNELSQEGAWAVMKSQTPSYSAAGYSTLFTGAWPELNDGPIFNLSTPELSPWTQDNLFSAARRYGLLTAVAGYEWFGRLIPADAVTAGYYTAGEDQLADREVVDAALPWLQSGDYALVLVHLDQVDYAGHHEGGPQDPGWNAAAQRVDDLLVEIVAELDFKHDTLFVCSDHGQVAIGGHGGAEPEVTSEPFLLVGAGVVPGEYPAVQMVDVAPTLAVLLGINLPASTQGLPRNEMLALSLDQQIALEAAVAIQQKQLADHYLTAIGDVSSIGSDLNIVSTASERMQSARLARLHAERLPRFLLAFALSIIPVGLLFWKRSPRLARLLAGALIFQVVYHFRYAVLMGKGYSFSYVVGPAELILDGLVNALVAFVIAWLVCCVGDLQLFRQPRTIAQETLNLALVVLLPPFFIVLWSYAMDGLWVRWTLPDFGRVFMALFALVQMLAIGCLGILFSGVGAFTAIILRRRLWKSA